MSQILSTEAICLRRMPWRETSRLATLLTRDYGKIEICAKGARRPGSRFGAALEILTLSRITFYHREHRHLAILSDAEIIDDYPALRSSLQYLRAGAIIADFTDQCFPLHTPATDGFLLLRNTLRFLNHQTVTARQSTTVPNNTTLIAFAYLFRAAGLLGFAPELRHCLACRRTRAAAFSPLLGGLLCSDCMVRDPDAIRITPEVLRLLQHLNHGSFAALIKESEVGDPRHRTALEIVLRHLHFHFDPLTLKTLDQLF